MQIGKYSKQDFARKNREIEKYLQTPNLKKKNSSKSLPIQQTKELIPLM